MMLEIDLNSKENEEFYDKINASQGNDVFLYNTLQDKLKQANISEEALMKWSRYVKLASSNSERITDLAEFAVAKILRSWKSIEGIIHLDTEKEEKSTS